MSELRIGSLFSGYGGLDIGVQAVFAAEVAWHVEHDPAPSRILEHHHPATPNHGDITLVDWPQVEPVHILTGGYPCQPFSTIGKRKGDQDARHLWPYYAAAIRSLRPRYAVLENVAGHLSLGFDRVLGDLAELGYDTDWIRLPASAAGAPHRRERVFILAHPANKSGRVRDRDHLRPRRVPGGRRSPAGQGASSDTDDIGSNRNRGTRNRWDEPSDDRVDDAVWGKYLAAIRTWEDASGRRAPWPGHPGGGVTTEFTEWMMGLPRGYVTSPEIGLTREQQAHALGNGVVPQQAELALRTLLEGKHV